MHYYCKLQPAKFEVLCFYIRFLQNSKHKSNNLTQFVHLPHPICQLVSIMSHLFKPNWQNISVVCQSKIEAQVTSSHQGGAKWKTCRKREEEKGGHIALL